MQNRKAAAFGVLATASMVLAACGNPAAAPPVIQTVVVEKEVPKEVVKEVEKIVEKQVEVAKEVVKEVVATSAPEWSTAHPILSNVKVRQAIAHCTDRDALIKVSYDFLPDADRAKLRMDTFMPKDAEFYAKEGVIDYTYDITAGGKLLDEAGWKLPEGGAVRANDKGEPLVLRFTTTNAAFRQTWAAVFEKQMSACGIVIQRSHVPGSIWFGGNSGLRRRDFDLGAFAWVGEAEPPGATLYACDQIPTPANNWNGQNYMGWCNEAASNAIKAGNNTLDRKERIKQYAIVQQEFSKDMISLPLFQRAESAGLNKNLKGFKADTTEYYTAAATAWEIPGKDTAVMAFTQEPASMFSLIESAFVQRLPSILINGGGQGGACYTQYGYSYQPNPLCMDKFPTIGDGATNDGVEPADGTRIVDAEGNLAIIKGGKAISLDDELKETDKAAKVRNDKGEVVDFAPGVKLLQLKVTHKFKANKWSDGEATKAADMNLAFKVDCARDSGNTTFFGCDRIASYEAKDVDGGGIETVTTLIPGYQSPTYFLPGGWGYPSHQEVKSEGANKGKKLADVATADFQKLAEIAETPLGTGPFVLTKWEKGVAMTLDANPNFGGTAPKVKKIIIQFFGDTNGAVAALLAGDVDVVGSETLGGGAEAKAVAEAAAAGKIGAVNLPSATWEHIDFNLNVR
jgi:ABC-type transport system substrate-binding protein